MSPDGPDMRQVIVQLAPAAAAALRTAGASATDPPAADIVRVAENADVRLEPLHPGVEEGELASHWYAVVSDDAAGAELVDRLRDQPGVEAAYVKPPDAAP